MAKILLLDGHSLVYRAFFAIPDDMATTSGVATNAVYGFASMLVNLLRDHRPDGIAVAFDLSEPTFRHEMVDDYKAGRPETPDTLIPQFALVRKVLDALAISAVEVPGFEADDVIATLATRAATRGDEVIVVSGDRDTFQLVSDPCVKVLYNKRGVSDYELYDEAGIAHRTGVAPSQYVTYAALRGDPSDNLPGVPGVGEKTAAKLVNTYGDLDGIYAHLDQLTPKLRENLAGSQAQARSNLEMMPLVRDIDVDLGPDDGRLGLGGCDPIKLAGVLDELEFRGLRRRLFAVAGVADPEADPAKARVGVVETAGLAGAEEDLPGGVVGKAGGTEATANDRVGDAATRIDLDSLEGYWPVGEAQVVKRLRQMTTLSAAVGIEVCWSGDPGRSELLGVGLVGIDGSASLCGVLWVDGSQIAVGETSSLLDGLFSERGGPRVVAHRAKEAMRSLMPKGIGIASLAMDTAVAAYLLEPGEGSYLLDDLAARDLALPVGAGVVAGPPGHGSQMAMTMDRDADSIQSMAAGALRRAATVLMLEPVLRKQLEETSMAVLYDRVENPLVEVLARMEVSGIGVDVEKLRQLNTALATEAGSLEREIQELAGVEFKVNSTPQLREVLYTKLGLAPSKKTKTGYSTDAASLEKLRDKHPVIGKLLRYREVEKLRSTYGVGLIAEVDPRDGRIHASFNQTVARTGRLSSDRPNLHNIPVRTEDGRRFREAFVSMPGTSFLVADYNQIELRVIAHLSGDPGLLEAFASGTDIHTVTASRIFGVDPSAVTLAQRSKAKMVSYGLSYGMEAFGLAGRLGIGVEEASAILGSFFSSFPAVKSYMDETVEEARHLGYTVTALGRRRPLPELRSTNRQLRLQGERQAMNAGTQGLAADIFKVALVNLARRLGEESLGSRVVLQVHDEVVVEVPVGEEAAAEGLTRECMVHAYSLSVPLEVNISWGSSWASAKA